MVAVYHKGVLDETFPSLPKAQAYVNEQLDLDWSEKPEDWSYVFY